MSFSAMLRRTMIRLDDQLRYGRVVREVLALGYLLAHGARRLVGGAGRTPGLLLRAAQFTRGRLLRTLIRRELSPWVSERHSRVHESVRSPVSDASDAERVTAVLLLKPPGPDGEKGVLFAGNESPWPVLARVARRTQLLLEYELVALSAWSPPKYAKLAEFVGLTSEPVLVGISNLDDLDGYRLLSPAIEPLPLMASDWLNPADFAPRPKQARDIDILMVSGWGRYKRHWLLFEALRTLPRGLRIVLIGRDSGNRTLADVKDEARLFGVPQDLTFLSGVPIQKVNEYQARAHVSVIFSGREGACVAVTESMFADTPVGLMRDAYVGSIRHINENTGTLFDRELLGRQLGDFLARSDRFHAREWALSNVSCHHSSAALNELLRERAARAGRPWTFDTVPLFRRYFVPRYLRSSDAVALADAHAVLRERHGLDLIVQD